MKKLLFISCIISSIFAQQTQAQFIMPKASGGENLEFKTIEKAFTTWHRNKSEQEPEGKWLQRWLDHHGQRSILGNNPVDASVFFKEAIKSQSYNKSGLVDWLPVGPNIESSPIHPDIYNHVSRINCIEFHPTDSNTFWIGASQGGIWRTTNGGDNWTPLNEGLPILRISDIKVDPNNTDIMYACLGDFEYNGVSLKLDDRKRHTHYGLGIYKSLDAGLTWKPTGLTVLQTDLQYSLLRGMLINPNNSNELIAGGLEGIWKSLDAGETWMQTLKDTLICDLEQDPSNPQTIYVASTYLTTMDEGIAGVLKSTDFGNTWTLLNTGIPEKLVRRTEIAIAPSDPNYIYALSCGLDRGFYAFYKSTDGGDTWQETANTSSTYNLLGWQSNSVGGQGSYDLALEVSPFDKNEVYLGGVNVNASSDGGITWNEIGGQNFWIHSDQHQYKINPLNNRLYICNDGGIISTSKVDINNTSGGTILKDHSKGMQLTSFYRLGLSANSDMIIAGAQDNSTFLFKDNQWNIKIGGDGMDCFIDPISDDFMMGSWQYGGLAASYDGGNNFDTWLHLGIEASGEKGEWVTPIGINPVSGIVYAAYENLWASDDYAASWYVTTEFPDMPNADFPAPASAMGIPKDLSGSTYIAKRIYHSYDAPSTLWLVNNLGEQNITQGLPDSLYFTHIAVVSDNEDEAYVTCSGFASGVKIFKTENGGNSWANISYNLPNIPLNSVVINENRGSHTLYIASDLGVYVLDSAQSEWNKYGEGFPNVIASDLEIKPSTNELFVSTFGRGIWKTELPDRIGVTEHLTDNISFQLTPNPNTGNFQITLTDNAARVDKMEILNVMGKLVHQQKINVSAQNRKLNINQNLKPGLYFLSIYMNGKRATKKFIIE
ncbi:MAG: photosystem II stability/assembly factor-like uncharacterized protein [Flavobacteriales bacterium]|jgi:photosystem II stability/assembly factor-like uncharacterized protein